jgi:WD40 repeat protein
VLQFDVNSGALQKKFDRVHSDAVLAVAFSPDGKLLATAAADRFMKVIDPATGAVLKPFEGHTGHVQSVAWKGTGRTLATGGADNVVKVWDFTAGAQTKSIAGFEKEVTAVRFVGDTDQILATAGDAKVRLVKDSGPDVRTFPGTTGFMYAVAATHDGTVILAGGEDGILRWWNGADGAPLTTFAPPPAAPK